MAGDALTGAVGDAVSGLYFLVILLLLSASPRVVRGGSRAAPSLLWFLIGFCLPVIGLIAALLYRWERQRAAQPLPALRRRAARSADQVCTVCGEDIAGRSPRRSYAAGVALRAGNPGSRARKPMVHSPVTGGGELGDRAALRGFSRFARACTDELQRGGIAPMRAVDAIMECLKAEGVDAVFGIPGGANLPDLRRALRRRHPQHPLPPRAGRRPRRRGLRQGFRQGRRGARDLGPGRDQPRHRDRRRDARLGARRCSSPGRSAPT